MNSASRRRATPAPVMHRPRSEGIKLPDALILATAMQVAAEQILTLDRRWRGVDSRVRLLEP